MEYIVPFIRRELDFVFVTDKNVSLLVVAPGWVNVAVTVIFVSNLTTFVLGNLQAGLR